VTARGPFSASGDASPANVARAMLTCPTSLAETRAKARALRDAVNLSEAAVEELGDGDQGEAVESRPTSTVAKAPTPLARSANVPGPTEAQRRARSSIPRARAIDTDAPACRR
jgi:hypothetical protein